MIATNYLEHHGILGMKWGIRRYQNEDGSLTEAGRRRLEKKDVKWAKKNYNKIYNETYKRSKSELSDFMKNDLNPRYSEQLKTGKVGRTYINEYNRKLAQLMNKNVSDIASPSGRTVQFVAKRGDVGVHMALADRGYDMSQLKNGVYGSGRIAYKQKTVNVG